MPVKNSTNYMQLNLQFKEARANGFWTDAL